MPRFSLPAVRTSLLRWLAFLLVLTFLPQLTAHPAQAAVPAPVEQFAGAASSVVPLYLAGEVGPNHYVQWVDGDLYVWSKAGDLLQHTTPGREIWQAWPGDCSIAASAEADVAYDAAADRWVLVMLENDGLERASSLCLAISRSANPAADWYAFSIPWQSTHQIHEPRLAVWGGSYLLTVSETSGGDWAGSGVAALERGAMLTGNLPQNIQFVPGENYPETRGLLPIDLDGELFVHSGTPPIFAAWRDGTEPGGSDSLLLWHLTLDWAHPEQAVFGATNHAPNAVIKTDDWTPLCPTVSASIPQPGTAQKLDARSGALSGSARLREVAGALTLVGSLTVDAGDGKAGLAWFMITNNGGGWELSQQGVYSHPKALTWLPAAALDQDGNLALVYALSSSTLYPSLAVTGRLAEDPHSTLPQGETVLVNGSASNLHSAGWSQQSSLAIDPVDGCTFWTSNAVLTAPGVMQTFISAFRYPNCGLAHPAYLQGTVRDSVTNAPVTGVHVKVGAVETVSAADGSYTLRAAAGAANVTFSAYGYEPQTHSVMLTEGSPQALNVNMVERPMIQVNGKVTDGGGHNGMPLYARLKADAKQIVFTDPVTGNYHLSLYAGESYSLIVTVPAGGYLETQRTINLAESTVIDFALLADPSACSAAGYGWIEGVCTSRPGGLVNGFVRDANNPPNTQPVGLVGAVVNSGAQQAEAAATPADAAIPDGFFQLFLPAGDAKITAAYGKYLPQTQSVSVTANSSARVVFDLPAGYLAAAPASITISVPRNRVAVHDIKLTNEGSALLSASFDPAAVDWLSVPSGSLNLAAAAQQTIQITIDTHHLNLGTYTTNLSLRQDTPYSFDPIPVELAVIPGHSLAVANAEYSGQNSSGGTAVVQIPVLNDGDFNEIYQVLISGGGWNYSAPSSLAVNAGQSGLFEFRVEVPASALSGDFQTWTAAFTSTADPTARREVTIRVNCDNRVFIPVITRP